MAKSGHLGNSGKMQGGVFGALSTSAALLEALEARA